MDAHKGDGTAEIFANDNSVRTFSIHMQNGWPLDGGDSDRRSFIASDMDVGVLPSDDYLANLQLSLNEFIKIYPPPDLIYVVGGVDVWEHDTLESSNLIKLTKQEVLKRDQLVFSTLAQLNKPLVYLMAGGYGEDAWQLYANFILWAEAQLKS
jgi:acetoin utilization deacetylase AcuC-like enzyme